MSKLFFILLDYFDMEALNLVTMDYIVIWEVLSEWYHFDLNILLNNYNSYIELRYWLELFKNNLDYFCWTIYLDGNCINDMRLTKLNLLLDLNYYDSIMNTYMIIYYNRDEYLYLHFVTITCNIFLIIIMFT
jgi:hypothetical protein